MADQSPALQLTIDELLELTWRRRLLVAACVLVFAALAAAASFVMTPRWRAQVVIVPVKGDDMRGVLSSALGQLGGLASLAGLGSSGGGNKEENLQFLSSRGFLRSFIEEENLLPVLFAKKWDATKGRWNVDDPDDVPTIADGVRYMDSKVRSVQEERRTGIVTLSIVWKDPVVAARWANLMVERANRDLRARAIGDAEASKAYLNAELAKTDVVELRQSVYRLIENQIKTIMLASVRPDYAFRIIDPAVPPDLDEKIRPKRTVMTVLGALAGGVFPARDRLAVASRAHAAVARRGALVGAGSLMLAALYALTVVGFPLVSTVPTLVGVDSQVATVPFRIIIVALSVGILYGWWVRGTRVLFNAAVLATLTLWALLVARMFVDTMVDPLPGDLGIPVSQFLLLSLGACYLPALAGLEYPDARTLDLARVWIEVLGAIAMLAILYVGLRGVFQGSVLYRLATPVLNPISVGHLRCVGADRDDVRVLRVRARRTPAAFAARAARA